MRNTRKGFTLIELMIVIAIIAIIAAIAIPGILSARRSANAGSALANLKSFSTAMSTYSQDQADQSYPIYANTVTPNFYTYYSHISPKGGYVYKYDCTGGKKFVYFAYPSSISNGTKLYMVDESNRIWESIVTDAAHLNPTAIAAFTYASTADGSAKITGISGTWTLKS